MFHYFVDRCHVGESYLSVIRYVIGRMKRGAFRKLPKAQRRAILRDIIARHRANRNAYAQVMAGR